LIYRHLMVYFEYGKIYAIFMPKIWQKVRMIETNEFEINCYKNIWNYT
jgi:hypothetical protein